MEIAIYCTLKECTMYSYFILGRLVINFYNLIDSNEQSFQFLVAEPKEKKNVWTNKSNTYTSHYTQYTYT